MYKGSVPGPAPAFDPNREGSHVQLFKYYFDRVNLTYPAKLFRRRFHMARHVFNCIRVGVMAHDDYFKCKRDALGKLGFSSYQKCTTAIQMLAYGVAGDLVDEYLRMGVSTCLEAMYKLYRAVIAVFGLEYLREPAAEDTARILAINERRGFSGMLGSIDCMH